MLEQHHIFTNRYSRKKTCHSKSKLKIVWKPLETKNQFSFKNKLDYQIKPLKLVFFFNNFSGELYFVELFKICVVMDQSPREGTLSKMLFVKGEVGSFFSLGSKWID